jgi:hypothetical protein
MQGAACTPECAASVPIVAGAHPRKGHDFLTLPRQPFTLVREFASQEKKVVRHGSACVL